MTSITGRLQLRLDARPPVTADPAAARPARRILALTAVGTASLLVVAAVGLVTDHRFITGGPAWSKPAFFGVAMTAYVITLRWMVGLVDTRLRLLTAIAVVVAAVFGLESAWVDLAVVRGTTSHFNQSTAFDAAAYFSMGGAISLVLVATIVVAVLAARARGLDAGIAAGIRWGLAVCVLGMVEAVAMVVNHSASDTGGHTVGAADGGPGMAITGWSLQHGDLRIGHFVGLHALQALPIVAVVLLRCSRLDERTRRDLLRVAGTGAAATVVLLWWQAERGQALVSPDILTTAAAFALAAVLAISALAVAMRGRRRRAAALG